MRVTMGTGLLAAGVAFAGLFTAIAPAEAKSARCYSSRDGYYHCNFQALDGKGSFTTWARGYPTYTFVVRDGFAKGVRTWRGRDSMMRGLYVRSRDDGACWQNPENRTKFCAW